MFQIIYKGEVIGLTDKPRYVRKKHGIYVECSEKKAEAIALKSVAYKGAIAKEVDGSEYVFEQSERITATESGVADTQDALCEASDEFDQRITDIEDALCELSE